MLCTPKANQLVSIVLSKDHPRAGVYHSRVEFISPKRLILAAPISQWQVIPVKRGEIITVNYWVRTKAYSFTSEVMAFKGGYLPTITVAWPRKIKRLKRRNFMRVRAKLSVTLAPTGEKRIYHTETLDISGGGVLIKSPVRLEENDYVELQITLPERGVFNILGRVVRLEERSGRKGTEYFMGIEFAVIDERDRERIIVYVFERERYLNRRRLV